MKFTCGECKWKNLITDGDKWTPDVYRCKLCDTEGITKYSKECLTHRIFREMRDEMRRLRSERETWIERTMNAEFELYKIIHRENDEYRREIEILKTRVKVLLASGERFEQERDEARNERDAWIERAMR